MPARLSTFVHDRRRAVLFALAPLLAVAAMFGGSVPTLLDTKNNFDDPDSEAVIAREALAGATGAQPAPGIVALVRPRGDVARVKAVLDADRDVARVLHDPRQTAKDGRSTLVSAVLRAEADEDDAALRLADELNAMPGVTAGGPSVGYMQVGEQVSEDLAKAEMIAFPILFLLSLWVFRGVVAALLPLAVGGTSILLTFLAMRLVNEATALSVFAVNLVTGLGLGLAIDYSLFVVSRFREELAKSGETAAAIRRTMATAGRTVIFSSITVAAAAAALIVFPQKFLYSMGIGGALVALIGAVVALTVLPALLAVLGPRVNSLAPARWQRAAEGEASGEAQGFWYRWSQGVMRRPGRIALVTAAVLIAAGLPFAGVKFTGVDASVLPESQSARIVQDALDREFDTNRTRPVQVAVRAPESAATDVAAFARRIEALPNTAAVEQAGAPVGGLWRLDVHSSAPELADGSQDLVHAIRDLPSAHPVLVGGLTAEFVDQQDSLGHHLPYAIALMALTTLVILFLMTGSIVLPVKTLVMNMLTISAAFGILVLVFQDGRLEGLLDYTSQGALESTQPILLFAMAFGLSTDYGVFLLTRIKEARDNGASERESVAIGLERTGRIVTAAALLFCIAIGAFATSEVIFIKQVGLGTALAVLIDATIVRALLVPSLMRLLGKWNWWAPRPLERVHRRLGLREGTAAA